MATVGIQTIARSVSAPAPIGSSDGQLDTTTSIRSDI